MEMVMPKLVNYTPALKDDANELLQKLYKDNLEDAEMIAESLYERLSRINDEKGVVNHYPKGE